MTVKNLSQFRESKVRTTQAKHNKYFGVVVDPEDETGEIFSYGSYYINIDENDGSLLLVIGNQIWRGMLEHLEEILWDDFAKWESGLTMEEIETDLHQRAKSFITSVGYNCSLDEIDADDLTVRSERRLKYLAKAFEEMQDRFIRRIDNSTKEIEVTPEPEYVPTYELRGVVYHEEATESERFKHLSGEAGIHAIGIYKNLENGEQEHVYDIEGEELKAIEKYFLHNGLMNIINA